jgi:Leishmanolysin/Bacterial Ig-like domain (group 1)/Bacterial Ig-like domain (group 2)
MLPLLRREACLALVLVAISACGSEPRVPTSISVAPGSLSFTALGQIQQLSPSVADQNGDPLTEAEISWGSGNGTVATVTETGLVTAQGPGTTEISASSGSANASVPVSVVQTPTQMVKISGDGPTGTSGVALAEPLVVEVEDALGTPVAGATVTFTTIGGGALSPATAITGTNGRASTSLTPGATAGNQAVIASVQATSISVAFTVSIIGGSPATIDVAAGDGQHSPAGTEVRVRPAVLVRDQSSSPVAGVPVQFDVISGGGSIAGASTVTNANGRADVGSWTLGSSGTNQLRATAGIGGLIGNPIIFTAFTTPKAFDIEVRFLSATTPAQTQAFSAARTRWEALLGGDLEDVPIDEPAGSCDEGTPALSETIDDVIIFATLEPIDGAGGILGQAGPCFVREPGLLPAVGVMFFDTEDLDFVQAEGSLQELILHEMGHVLGYGTLWPFQGLLADPADANPPDEDTHFTGSQAFAAFDEAGGSSYVGGKVPVENDSDFGEGTRNSHWRESVFSNELMTGFLDVGITNPLSAITIASLADQGYSVDLSQAEEYTLSTAGLRLGGARRVLRLENDVRRTPIKLLDRTGRLVRVIRP